MNLADLLTGDSDVARKFRAVTMWSDIIHCEAQQHRTVLGYAAAVALGDRPDHEDWREDLELRRGIAELRGETWFDDSQPWRIVTTSQSPCAMLPVPGNTKPKRVEQSVALAVIREAVASYGITD